MVTEKPFPIRDLPSELTADVNEYIRFFSVTMLLMNEANSQPIPCAGTLTKIGENYGIITARHVWENFSKHKNLLLMTGKTPFLIETDKLSAVVPPTLGVLPETDISIPDIAYIKFPSIHGGEIEALSKAFYSLDKRANDAFLEFCKKISGYWPLFGAPKELVDYENKYVPSFLFGTYVSKVIEIDGWDYLIMGLNLDENPELPKNFEGVSGGGIWKVKFYMNEEMDKFKINNHTSDIALCGVNFFQTDLESRQIVGHGPISIYRCLYGRVSDDEKLDIS